jgi:hypothetical protein
VLLQVTCAAANGVRYKHENLSTKKTAGSKIDPVPMSGNMVSANGSAAETADCTSYLLAFNAFHSDV